MALALGRSHAELAATMSHRELVEWQVYCAMEPRGEERADWQAGWIAYVLASINARRRRKLKWADFIPFRRAPKENVDLNRKVIAAFSRFPRQKG